MDVSFNNTQRAFAGKSLQDLRRMYLLFSILSQAWMVNIGKSLLNLALKVHFPIHWILKPSIFKQFCGGENIEEAVEIVNELEQNGIKSILDYSAEGIKDEAFFDTTVSQILATIEKSKTNSSIPFAVFKMTGICRLELLEKISLGETLSESESLEYEKVLLRVDLICRHAQSANISVIIDAEESWIQPAIDDMVEEMQDMYNKTQATVYNTLQMYRTDRLEYLKNQYEMAKTKNIHLGFKLVRGAYLEKERDRAIEKAYISPVFTFQEATHQAYNQAVDFCVQHIDRIALFAGTHNEESCYHLMEIMQTQNIPNHHPRIYFSQLFGMSDHISYNLSAAQYNVAKYLPYGPLKLVLPYLIRRAEENTSIRGQTGRELGLIKLEKKRRKSQKRK